MASEKKSILVEGWRGINHSYAMVNQYQLLELSKYPVDLAHNDLPFAKSSWNLNQNGSGFNQADTLRLAQIPSAVIEGGKFDVNYRISYPFRMYPSKSERLYVFGTSEFQNLNEMIYEDGLNDALKNRSLSIVTPSQWSKVGFLKAGFREESIFVVPHGIDPSAFKPLTSERRRQFRSSLKINDDQFLILSVGSMTWNKGIDVLLKAFFILAKQHHHVRLVLKDQSKLYGIFANKILASLQAEMGVAFPEGLKDRITFISENLTISQLNGLYGAADCYVSPYRAEGFNLTPLEAAASGTPIVLTAGGATDDYVDQSFATTIEGQIQENDLGTYIEPNLDDLIDKLNFLILGGNPPIDAVRVSLFIEKHYSWRAAVQKLTDTLFDN